MMERPPFSPGKTAERTRSRILLRVLGSNDEMAVFTQQEQTSTSTSVLGTGQGWVLSGQEGCSQSARRAWVDVRGGGPALPSGRRLGVPAAHALCALGSGAGACALGSAPRVCFLCMGGGTCSPQVLQVTLPRDGSGDHLGGGWWVAARWYRAGEAGGAAGRPLRLRW